MKVSIVVFFKAIQKISRLEPNKNRTTKSLKGSLDTPIPVWQAQLKEVRTALQDDFLAIQSCLRVLQI